MVQSDAMLVQGNLRIAAFAVRLDLRLHGGPSLAMVLTAIHVCFVLQVLDTRKGEDVAVGLVDSKLASLINLTHEYRGPQLLPPSWLRLHPNAVLEGENCPVDGRHGVWKPVP